MRIKKDTKLNSILEKVSQNISEKNFAIRLEKIDIPGNVSLYTIPNSPEQYFAIKQVERNLNRLFSIKQANRQAIVEQVIVLLNDGFPKYVLKTDIKGFYENIEHAPLLRRINADNLLTPFSRKILIQILTSYKDKSFTSKGIPRGIGVSAYLAELYMRDIDREIKDLNDVIYYARYVDDIIIIFSPKHVSNSRDYLSEVKTIIEEKNNLQLNNIKQKHLISFHTQLHLHLIF